MILKKRKKLEKEPIPMKLLKSIYEPDKEKIFFDEDKIEILKLLIKRLPSVDRNIIILYLENDLNVIATAKLFSCSKTLLRTKINEIKVRLKDDFISFYYNDNSRNTD